MFERLELLTEQRAEKMKALESLMETQGKKDYKPSEEDAKKAEKLDKDLDALETEIKFLQKQKQRQLDDAGDGVDAAPTIMKSKKKYEGSEELNVKEAADSFSITRAVNILKGGVKLDGPEKIAMDLSKEEAKTNSVNIEGFGIPGAFINTGAKAATGVSAGQGGDFIANDLSSNTIGFLYPRLVTDQLGVKRYTGLTSNLDIPKKTNRLTAAWEGEFDDNANTQMTTGVDQVRPYRIGAYSDIGKQVLSQARHISDQMIVDDLRTGVEILIDTGIWNGNDGGVTDPLTGFLNLAGTTTVAIGTNGGAPTRDLLIDMESEIAALNADISTMGYATTPQMRGKLKKTAEAANSGMYVWGKDNTLNGYQAVVSTQLPSGLTKGSSSDCHSFVFGCFDQASLYQFGGYDLVIDHSTQALKSTLRIVANSWWDFHVRHAASFSIIVDARDV